MAEALGSIASLLTIVNSVARVIRTIQSCHNATKEANQLVDELIYVRGLLDTLKDTIAEQERSDGTWSLTKSILGSEDGLFHQFQQLLDLLEITIGNTAESKGFKKLKCAAKWPYKEPEAMKLISSVERYKSLFGLALQNKHLQLSQALCDSIAAFSTDLDSTKEMVASSNQQVKSLNNKTDESKYQVIFHWLSKWNYWSKQQDILSQRVGDTSSWFLTNNGFQQWMSGGGSSLVCFGPPGIGKTVLSSVIVEYLESQSSASSCLLAFFCSQSDLGQDKHQLLLGSILQQLFRRQESSRHAIQDLYNRHSHGTWPTSAELLSTVCEELAGVDQIYLIIDALDEWSSNPKELKKLINDLQGLGDHVNILVTSRPLPPIEELLHNCIRVDICLPRDDLRAYIRTRCISSEQSFLIRDHQLQRSVERRVLDSCEGLFLLARLQMDELLRQRHKRAFLRTLDTLPRTPDALYDAAIDRIEHQQADDASLAKQSLAWVYYAFEPVSVNLLQYALAIQPGDNMIDEDGCVDVEVLVTLCGGLIVLDRDSKVIRFVHTTTRTYFDQYYRRQKQQQEAQLTVTCLTFLLSTTFENFADASFRALRSKVRFDLCGNSRMMEFLVYASRHALSHYKSTKKSPKCFALVQQLFTGNETLAIFWRARWRSLTKACGWYLGQVTDSDKLCLASFLGLDGIVSWLLDSGISPNTQDSTGQTALYAAASRGEESVVKVLLAREADPNQISFDNPSSLEIDSNAQRFCQTPMHCALRSGNVITAQTLINHGVELHPSTYDSKTCVSPLRIAIQSNSRDMVEFVLKHRHEDLYEGGGLDAQPPLHDAIENGAVDVVAALLEAGASTTKTSRRGHSPVETAIVAPIWRVSDDKSEQICKLIVAHCPSRYSLSRNVRFGQYATWNAGTRPRTFQYLKSVGAWNWSGKFLDQRRRSI